jgi:hypothetical protein
MVFGNHACVPKHRHETFRQRQALRRAGTGLPAKLHRIAFSLNNNLKLEMNQGISEDRNFGRKDP